MSMDKSKLEETILEILKRSDSDDEDFISDSEEDAPEPQPSTSGAAGVSSSKQQIDSTDVRFDETHLPDSSSEANDSSEDEEESITKRRKISQDISQNFDCTFWCGDLNFRLDRPREEVMEWIVSQQFPSKEPLELPSDQLQKAISEGAVFKSFGEAAIKFPPTYKFDPGTDHFDSSSKMRTPSYTDRILYKPANRDDKKTSNVECLNYYSAHSIRTSDHKPVWSVFKASIRPGKDTIPLAAGLFNREVYLEGIKRRAAAIHSRQGYSTVCNIQ